jgi:hypothetical protein
MAVFVWPAPKWVICALRGGVEDAFLSGMAHMAGYHRVGMARKSEDPRHPGIDLTFGPNDVWGTKRGWRVHAYNMLVGKRQIGTQRFSILDELEAMEKRQARAAAHS